MSRKEQLQALANEVVADLEALGDKYEKIIGDELEALRDKYRQRLISIILPGLENLL